MTTAAYPSTPEELAELAADPEQWSETFGDPDKGPEALAHYQKATNKADVIGRQVADQAAAAVMDMLKQEGATDRPDFTDLAEETTAKVIAGLSQNRLAKLPISVYNPKAMGAKLDDKVGSAAEFFQTIWHNADRTDPEIQNKLAEFRNAFSSTVPAEGGFLIPERLRATMLEIALESGVVRPLATVIPMDSLRVPMPTIDDTSHASNVYGGVTAYWAAEGATLTASEASFGQVVLEASKLIAYAVVPNELLSDSIVSFETFINTRFPQAVAWFEDLAFLTGNGAGQPEGVLNGSGVISVAKQSGQAADTVVWENIVKMYARMLPESLGRAVWVVNHNVFYELATMALSVGTGGSAIWLNNGVTGPPMTILGRPVIQTEKVPTLGDAGDINFIDFSHYLVGDRQVMSARSSEHIGFNADTTAFRITQRVDGKPWVQSAITPYAGDTLSPYVSLAERA